MADMHYAGMLSVQASRMRGKIVSLSTVIEALGDSGAILQELQALARKVGSLPRATQLSIWKSVALNDAAHYFGTIPMRDKPNGGEVSGFFKIEGMQKIWSLGSSGFPHGSHGHPTLLSILTAHRAIESIRSL
jgi:hypothetical protein